MEYTLTVKLKEVKESIVNTEIKESKIYMKNTDKFIEIELEEDKPKSFNDLIEEAYIDISNIFKEIKIDKKSSDISNLKELIAKWESVKKKIVFNTDSDMLVNFIINISKYYENEKSLVYIPLFDEVSENNSEDVSNFLSIIKDLKNKDQNDKNFKDNYYLQKVKELKYKDTYRIKIKEYKKVDGYLLPIKMEIFESESKVADLDLKDTKVHSDLKRKELKK